MTVYAPSEGRDGGRHHIIYTVSYAPIQGFRVIVDKRQRVHHIPLWPFYLVGGGGRGERERGNGGATEQANTAKTPGGIIGEAA